MDDDARFERGKALFFEGLEHFQAGRHAAAADAFEASLRCVPDRPSTLANLGAARVESGQPELAVEPLERALAAEPHDHDARTWLGVALAALGRYDEALAAHDTVLGAALDRAANWYRRGQVLQALGRHAEALASHERALGIDPTLAVAWTQKGGLLRDAGRLAEAARAYEQALAHGGDPVLNGWYLASVAGRDAPASAPPDYVVPFFDEYAESFDGHLVGDLRYRAPERLVAELAAVGPPGYGRALDLGCGTGLLGALLRTQVAHLDGVDVSERMLERARARGVYDELARDDAAAFLAATPHRYDLVASADVFIYVGDLDAVFAGVARALRPGGLFAFTVEAAAEGAASYVLQPSLRYAHARGYLEQLAARHAFAVRLVQRAPLREEQGRPVEGWYVVLAR